jgi:hypothetical protein
MKRIALTILVLYLFPLFIFVSCASSGRNDKKVYMDVMGNKVEGDVIPDGFKRIPPIGAPPKITLFNDPNKYKRFIKTVEKDLKNIGFWGAKDTSSGLTSREALIKSTQNYWNFDVSFDVVGYVFIYHHLENRIIVSCSDEYVSFYRVYCLGEQDNLDGTRKSIGPVWK